MILNWNTVMEQMQQSPNQGQIRKNRERKSKKWRKNS